MFKRSIFLALMSTFAVHISAHKHATASYQDFPVGCLVPHQQIISQELLDEATELLTSLTAISLLASNRPISQAIVSTIARIFARTIKFIRAHYGYSYGLFPKLVHRWPKHKPRNAMDEIDAIIKQTQPNAGDKETQFVLHSFANIIHNFANIVGNPRNPDVVANNVTHIFSGLVSIAKEAITKGQEPLFLLSYEHQLTQEIIKQASHIEHEES